MLQLVAEFQRRLQLLNDYIDKRNQVRHADEIIVRKELVRNYLLERLSNLGAETNLSGWVVLYSTT